MRKLLLTALAAFSLSAPAGAATIFSEDFESGFGVFTDVGNVYLANGAIYQGCCGTPNDTSNWFVAFGGGNDPSGTIISTSFMTMLGYMYTVTFDYSALGGGSESLTLQAGGTTYVVNPTADNSLSSFMSGSFTFAGTGALTSLDVFSGGVDNVDAIIDNITVSQAVPEPTTWALLLLGFGGVGFSMRRRRARHTYLPQSV